MKKYPVVELGDICDEIYRYPSFYGMEHFSVGVPVIRGEHIDEWGNISQNWSDFWFVSEEVSSQFPRTILREGDLVFTVRGTIGKVGLITKAHDGAQLSPNLIRFSPKREKVDSIFLWYFLQSIKETAAADIQNEVTIASVRASDLSELKIPLPPLTEQKRIASLLTRADRLRHLRRTAHELGESLLQSVFLEMFGDAAINSKNWEKIELGDALDVITYGLTVRPEYIEKGIPLISAREIRSGIVEFGDAPRISEKDFSETYDKGKPQKGDILFSKTGTIGSCAEVTTDETFAITQNVARLCFKKKLVNNAFAIQYLRTPFFQEMAKEASKGNAVQDLQLGVMQQFPFYLPPLSLQKEFAGMVARVESLRGRMSEGERQVEGLFEALLAQTMDSGR